MTHKKLLTVFSDCGSFLWQRTNAEDITKSSSYVGLLVNYPSDEFSWISDSLWATLHQWSRKEDQALRNWHDSAAWNNVGLVLACRLALEGAPHHAQVRYNWVALTPFGGTIDEFMLLTPYVVAQYTQAENTDAHQWHALHALYNLTPSPSSKDYL